MTPQQTEFLDFLFSLIGSCQLQQLTNEELEDFIRQVYKKYTIVENNMTNKIRLSN